MFVGPIISGKDVFALFVEKNLLETSFYWTYSFLVMAGKEFVGWTDDLRSPGHGFYNRWLLNAHFTMRTHGVNQAFRFVEGIWLHRKSHRIRFFYIIRAQREMSNHLI